MTGAERQADGQVRQDIDGIILLDKPIGMSSNRALQRVKGLLRARKAGHTGSLDPLATGMLPICLGEATKVSGYLLDADKLYRVRLAFGLATSTGDDEGTTEVRGIEEVAQDDLAAALRFFEGPGLQMPPMYSALKVGGQPLYRLARAGREIERAPREIMIHKLAIEEYDSRRPVLRVHCSKGTYIRTLVEDIARRLGTVARTVELRRLWVAPFSETEMVSLEQLEQAVGSPAKAGEALLLPVDRALGAMPVVSLEGLEAARVMQGQAITPSALSKGVVAGLVRLYGPAGQFLGIGEWGVDGRILGRRLVRHPSNRPGVQTGCI